MIDMMSLIDSKSLLTPDKDQTVNKKTLTAEHEINTSKKKGVDRDVKLVAKEMESLFAYQLLKVMRESLNNISPDRKGFGYNTYMSLFDMEVSKLFAEKGLGLQDSIIKWLERVPGISDKENNTSEK